VDAIESFSTELLRRHAGRALSLLQLHGLLLDELGPRAGTYHQLHQRLKKSSAPLRILERSHPFPGELNWPPETRVLYERALEDAGYDVSPIVALAAGADESPTVLDELRATLLSLSEQLQDEDRINIDIVAALTGLPELQNQTAAAMRPTTLPRNPP